MADEPTRVLPISTPITGKSKTPVPTVGRVVHYVSHGTPVRPDGTQEFTSQPRAAIITSAVESDGAYIVSLAVLNPTGMFFNEDVPYDESGTVGGTWHWPERV